MQVPLGTIIKEEGRLLIDLTEDGQKFTGARGGVGGKGNKFFATDTNQTPEVAERGLEGEFKSLTLEIRSVAHIGLVSMHDDKMIASEHIYIIEEHKQK
jgi:GTPase